MGRDPSAAQPNQNRVVIPRREALTRVDSTSGKWLAGSGHIAGVVNPPASNKYQYWTCDEPVSSLDEFVAKAKETPGSWWPDWIKWLQSFDDEAVPVKNARVPGKGALKAIEDAPGRYVKSH